MTLAETAERTLSEDAPLDRYWVYESEDGYARCLCFLDEDGVAMTQLIEDDRLYEECFRFLKAIGRPVTRSPLDVPDAVSDAAAV